MGNNEDTKEVLGEVEVYLKTHQHLPIEEAGKDDEPYDKLRRCKHLQIVLDKEAHSITCRHCHKVLDPFWYLRLLAEEWDLRRYRDSQAIEACRQLEQSRLNKEAKGKITERPNEGEARQIWDDFVKWKGREPNYIFREGKRGEWRINDREIDNGRELSTTYGHAYIKMMLAGKKI